MLRHTVPVWHMHQSLYNAVFIINPAYKIKTILSFIQQYSYVVRKGTIYKVPRVTPLDQRIGSNTFLTAVLKADINSAQDERFVFVFDY